MVIHIIMYIGHNFKYIARYLGTIAPIYLLTLMPLFKTLIVVYI